MKRPVRALIALATLASTTAASAANRPLETQRCNDPPALGITGVDGSGNFDVAQVTGKWLKPGTTRQTRGTNFGESPELDGFIVYSNTQDFSFVTSQGPVAGKYTELVIQGADLKCKCQIQIAVRQGCVAKVAINDYVHPLKLVADWRQDFPGNVPSSTATRTLEDPDKKTTITFNMAANVCSGQTSRFLLLNTNVEEVERLNTLQFIAPNGQGSNRFPFHVPLAGQ